ncbi:hypothetical protein LguiA_034047 [Lonicera macranthoides]
MFNSSSFCFSFSFSFLFFFLITPSITSPINPLSIDLINTTCAQCAKKSTIIDYTFCLTSLQAVSPSRHVTNIQGLGIIAMELALGNATATVTTVEKMLTGRAVDPFAKICLLNCLELYADAVSLLVNSIGAFLTEQYDAVNLLMGAICEITATCEELFTEKKGGVSPLTKENYNLFELSDIALCINSLVS